MSNHHIAPRTGAEKTDRRSFFVTLCFALLWAAPAWGQAAPLGEQEVISQGLAWVDFETQQRSWESVYQGEAAQATAWDNPSLGYQREQLGGGNPDLDTWLLTQPVDLSGRRGLRQQAGQLRIQAQEQRLSWARTRYTLQLKEAFYQVLYQQSRAEQVQTWALALQNAHDTIEARVQGGESSLLELKRIQNAQHLVASLQQELELEREQAWSRLSALAGGLEAGAWPRVQGELQPQLSDREGPPPQERADLKALELEGRSLQREADAAARGWVPGLQLGLGYLRQTGNGQDGDGFTVVLGLELPLFSRGQGARQAAQGRADLLESQRRRELSQAQVLHSGASEAALRRTEVARRFRDGLAQAKETAQLAQAAYEGGELPLGELLQVYEQLHDMQERSMALDWEARRAQIALRRLQGKDL